MRVVFLDGGLWLMSWGEGIDTIVKSPWLGKRWRMRLSEGHVRGE